MTVVAPNMVNTVDVAFRLPLMKQIADAQRFDTAIGTHEIYVPSNYGGRLTVGFRGAKKQHVGKELAVRDPKGVIHTADENGRVHVELEPNHRGNGRFGVAVWAPSGSYEVFALFDEVGFARTGTGHPIIPYNFWYYPFSQALKEHSAWGGTVMQPIQRYEEAFGVEGVLAWEREFHADPTGTADEWEGHCHLAAPASLMFWPPPDAGITHNGVAFSCEELKYFAAEFFGQYGNVRLAWQLPEGANGDPRLHEIKPSEAPSLFGDDPAVLPELLHTLRREIRIKGHALVMDLRDAEGKEHRQKWNHAVFFYETRYWQPDILDPTLTEGRTKLVANADLQPDKGGSTGMPAEAERVRGEWTVARVGVHKEVRLGFVIRFGRTGFFDLETAENVWHSVKADGPETFAPRFARVVQKPFDSPGSIPFGNPRIAREHVLELLSLRPEFS